MTLSPAGENLIKGFEALRLEAYQDEKGIWTIGWGHTLNVKPGDVITEDQAEMFFQLDTLSTVNAVNALVKVPLTQNQFDALVSLVFNIGNAAFRGSHILVCLNLRDYQGAAERFLQWDHETIGGVLQVSQGLLKRRTRERDFFLTV